MFHNWIFLGLLGSIMGLDRNWWKSTEVYEVLVMSFKDSDGDGIGDLNGIKSKLDHFVDLQIGSIWLTPFYESPFDDIGYDISNYTKIHPMFGTMEDFEELCSEAKKRGIKIIIDMVINHSSDEHIWFKKSIDKISPYDEFYVWQDPKGYHNSSGEPIPPNNWLSIFSGGAWQWSDKRKQFYYHLFGTKQPDFNLRNEKLKQEIKKIIKFWFDKGVNGLRMDAVQSYMEDKLLRDELVLNTNVTKDKLKFLDLYHNHTIDLWENVELLHELRLFVDEMNKKKGGLERIIITESHGNGKDLRKFYGSKEYAVAHFPFNFGFVAARDYFTSKDLHEKITEWLTNMPKHGVANWVAEDHDELRIDRRFVREFSHILNFLVMMLPGVACIYYGQEIGMVDSPVRPDQRRDHHHDPVTFQSRDGTRTPMQWDNSLNSGFTTNLDPWLPVNPNYWSQNVETQKKNENSFYNIFKELSQLRKTKTCKNGAFNSYVLSTWIYAFTRVLKGSETFVIVINLGTKTEIVSLNAGIPNLGNYLEVLVASDNAGYKKGETVRAHSLFPHLFLMRPMSAVALTSKTRTN